MKLYIISNRLPVKAVHRDGAYLFSQREGGLATVSALTPVTKNIGSAGREST